MQVALPIALMMLLPAAPSAVRDRDTDAWWRTSVELSSDAMEGRDTGSRGYDRAAALVVKRLADLGLKPLGDHGGWLQQVSLEERAIDHAAIRVGGQKLAFLHDITVAPSSVSSALDLPIVYGGYCSPSALGDVRGKLVICHGTRRPGLPSAAQRMAALVAAGAGAVATISDPGFTVEPPRWPFAYARDVWIAGAPPEAPKLPSFILNATALGAMIRGSDRNAEALVKSGSEGAPLPTFSVPARFRTRFDFSRRHLQSANILGLLPGTDPALANEPIVLTAHLDGYGFGEAVGGDKIYNGTLDDAAYVALIIRLLERRGGRGFRRPVLVAAVTGEEKGLLGSKWLVQHPPAGLARFAADINLDQLRPIFPLDLLTVHGLDDSSLGDDARKVAGGLGIAVQFDQEPERNLLQRSDHWNFMQAGIPAVNFVFGYRPGTESERIYRRWYQQGYHRPQDDPKQRIDWKAAADFNRFFYALVERVADQNSKPMWHMDSPRRPQRRP